jgi:hypothetical protein
MIAMEELRHDCAVAVEVAFCSFRYAFSAPRDQDVFRQCGVRILDLDECKLYSAIRKIFY